MYQNFIFIVYLRRFVVEHKGDPKLVAESVNRLIKWARSQTIKLKPKPGEAFGIAYDDPKTSPAAAFRFDLGMKVPENLKLEGVIEKYLPSGRYATTLHKGSLDKLVILFMLFIGNGFLIVVKC